jgi:cell division control protein 24
VQNVSLTSQIQVARTINIVLDAAESRGLLLDPEQDESVSEVIALAADGSKPKRYYIVEELVSTERKYVQDLENLHELKKAIEAKGVVTGDIVHAIFLNLNAILDFQRRFLIKIETTNSQTEANQRWGLPFVNYEEAFHIYQPFIANQGKAAALALQEFDKIRLADHPVALESQSLNGFLLKPMQRLGKYPMLLRVCIRSMVLQAVY